MKSTPRFILSAVFLSIWPGCASLPNGSSNPHLSQMYPETYSEPEQKAEESAADFAAEAPLSLALEREIAGIGAESEESRAKLQEQAELAIAIRKGKAPAAKRRAKIEECRGSELSDPFCPLILRGESAERKQRKVLRSLSSVIKRKPSRSARAKIRRELLKANYEAVNGLSESELISAMKEIHEASKLRAISNKALAQEDCPSTALLASLGLKMEQGLPDPEYRQMAKLLYSRAAECGPSGGDASTERARFRLGLLHVWAGEFEAGEKAFAGIIEQTDAVDYRSRAIYWRYYCAQELGNRSLRNNMRETLLKEYPLSLHALLISDGAQELLEVAQSRDPEVAFRSENREDLNPTVRGVEMLQKLGHHNYAQQMLEPMLEDVKEAEPPFQLYVAVLLTRSKSTLLKFQLIASIFRDEPKYISKSSLQMLYPLRKFDIIKSHEARLDPWLALSLIRQESAFNEKARSHAGALGLMQLMPGTARRLERRVSRRQLLDPETNIRLGVKYFSNLLARYQGDAELALAAYNAGPHRVEEWVKRYPTDNRMLFIDLIPFRETREYVASIARNYHYYFAIYGQDSADSERAPASSNGRRLFPLFHEM